MYIYQLTDAHRSQRTQIKYQLEKSGWEGRKTNTLFEEGRWVPDEAAYDYYGPAAFLSLLYSAEEESLELIIDDPVGRLSFVLCPGPFLTQALDELIHAQNELSCVHYHDFINKMITLLPETFVYQHEVRMRLVHDD